MLVLAGKGQKSRVEKSDFFSLAGKKYGGILKVVSIDVSRKSKGRGRKNQITKKQVRSCADRFWSKNRRFWAKKWKKGPFFRKIWKSSKDKSTRGKRRGGAPQRFGRKEE